MIFGTSPPKTSTLIGCQESMHLKKVWQQSEDFFFFFKWQQSEHLKVYELIFLFLYLLSAKTRRQIDITS